MCVDTNMASHSQTFLGKLTFIPPHKPKLVFLVVDFAHFGLESTMVFVFTIKKMTESKENKSIHRLNVPGSTASAPLASFCSEHQRNVFMAGTQYFGETAVQPRDHTPVNTMRKSHNHTLSRH